MHLDCDLCDQMGQPKGSSLEGRTLPLAFSHGALRGLPLPKVRIDQRYAPPTEGTRVPHSGMTFSQQKNLLESVDRLLLVTEDEMSSANGSIATNQPARSLWPL